MDPDIVRQQEEAEREAMQLAAKKAPVSAQLTTNEIFQAMAAKAAKSFMTDHPAAGAAPPSSPLVRPLFNEVPAASLAPFAAAESARHSMAFVFGQFFAFGLAGAMLGGSLGIAAANYMQLSADAAKLAIFGSAGVLAAACGTASFFSADQKR